MRLGIFGGSFDPVHYGHLLLAECAREQLALDEVWLIPTAVSPFKVGKEQAPAKARLEMLQLALASGEQLRASPIEIDRGGISYTVETLAEVARQQPDTALFLLMGADALRDLPSWREPARICELATPAVVRRGGAAEPEFKSLAALVSPARLSQICAAQIEMPAIDLSSTDLRARAAAGKSLRYRMPRAVEKYIETHRLYQQMTNDK
jgi:nicotinate-nucleotide adenylyltransferase